MNTIVVLGIVALALAAVYFFVIRKKVTSVADITKPLHDIVNKLEGHAANQHEAAAQHEDNAQASNAAAAQARGQRDHAKAVAGRVKELLVTKS